VTPLSGYSTFYSHVVPPGESILKTSRERVYRGQECVSVNSIISYELSVGEHSFDLADVGAVNSGALAQSAFTFRVLLGQDMTQTLTTTFEFTTTSFSEPLCSASSCFHFRHFILLGNSGREAGQDLIF
jgi:hypothetical protein